VEGAFLVSATLKNGEVAGLTIVSEQGRPLKLLNPWKGHKIKVTGQGVKAVHEGERIEISTKAGITYRFTPV
jgi:hypothetical protein